MEMELESTMALNAAECITLPARRNPDGEAIVFDDLRLTFGTLLEQAQRVAAYLHRSGVRPGDRVVILLPNTPHFPIIYYGALYAGAIAVPLNFMQTSRELHYLFDDITPAIVFYWADLADTVEAALSAAKITPRLVLVEPDLKPQHPRQGDSFLQEMAQPTTLPAMAETRPDDVAVIIYTAAYAGRPLGAQLTHFNVFQNAYTVGALSLSFQAEDRSLCVLPLFHSFGLCVIMNASLLSGACVVLLPRFDAGKVLEVIAAERISTIGLVPTMYHLLLTAKSDMAVDMNSVRRALVGGAPMPLTLLEGFRERFGVTILEGYGLTETSPAVSFNMSVADNRIGSVGLPLWGCEVRAVDEQGEPLPAGEVGEIAIRGHNVMKGYWNQPEKSADILRNGWLLTGDLGSLDEDGYIYIRGLKKDMLIRAGLNVYPREIELVLEGHPAVAAAAVVGVPDAVRGEEVLAIIEVSDAFPDLEKELKRYCRANLAGYKCPRTVEVVDALPRRADGTVDKGALSRRL